MVLAEFGPVTEYSAAKLQRGQLNTALKAKYKNPKFLTFFSFYAQKVVVLKSKALRNFKIIDFSTS